MGMRMWAAAAAMLCASQASAAVIIARQELVITPTNRFGTFVLHTPPLFLGDSLEIHLGVTNELNAYFRMHISGTGGPIDFVNRVYPNAFFISGSPEIGERIEYVLTQDYRSTLVNRVIDFGTPYEPGLFYYLAGSPAPELSTWAMMLIGFGGLGATAWWRKDQARRSAKA